MLFEPRTALLKNGAEVILRLCLREDVPAFHELVADYLADSPYIPREPEEFNPTESELFEWTDSFNRPENSFLMVAEYGGKLVGNLDIRGSERKNMAHTGVIGMGLRSSFRNIGLGSALMENAIQLAKDTQVLEYLWLQVYAANESGQALYRKFGFKECGRQKRFFRHGDQYFDLLIMELEL